MKDGSDPVVRPNAVYNQMGLLLKSLLCVSRVLPAYKFARSQGPDTHVMCYRVFAGERSTNPLGSGQQTAHVSIFSSYTNQSQLHLLSTVLDILRDHMLLTIGKYSEVSI